MTDCSGTSVSGGFLDREARAIFESITDAFVVLDSEWRVWYINSEAARINRKPASEIMGRNHWEEWPATVGTEVERQYRRALREQTAVHFEYHYVAPGYDLWTDIHAYPFRSGLAILFRDISHRKRSEEALRESEDRYRSLVLATSAFVWTADANGEFSRPQPSWEAYTGQSWEEYRGSKWIGAVHPEDRLRVAEVWRKAVESCSNYEVEWRTWHAAKREWRHCIARGVPVRESDGQVREWVGAVTDVHERKLLDDKLQQDDKLDSLGVLAGGVAHDFNNLLVAIMGNASLALEGAGPSSRGLIEDILRASERAAELTQQMLAYAGRGQWVFEPLDLSQEVREVVRLVRSSLGPAAHLELELAGNLPLIRGDRGQIRQVITNLLINAGEALEKKEGRIRVATAPDPTRARTVMLTVQDDGKGMTPEVKSRIFEPFFSTKFLGRGLGLAAATGILRVHGGMIDVDTAPGRGTTFRISLPAMEAEAGAERPKGKKTVLVIDDEDVVLRTVENTLARAGIRTIRASSGRQGIRIFQERSYEIDLVLLDVTMPDLGGREVLRELRTVQTGVPVIASSGHSASEVERYFGEEAPTAILPKPYRPEALTAAIAAHMRGGDTAIGAAGNRE